MIKPWSINFVNRFILFAKRLNFLLRFYGTCEILVSVQCRIIPNATRQHTVLFTKFKYHVTFIVQFLLHFATSNSGLRLLNVKHASAGQQINIQLHTSKNSQFIGFYYAHLRSELLCFVPLLILSLLLSFSPLLVAFTPRRIPSRSPSRKPKSIFYLRHGATVSRVSRSTGFFLRSMEGERYTYLCAVSKFSYKVNTEFDIDDTEVCPRVRQTKRSRNEYSRNRARFHPFLTKASEIHVFFVIEPIGNLFEESLVQIVIINSYHLPRRFYNYEI